MRKYVIKDLERLSGVKSHTIRIWEQRYNLLTPSRTETNIRYYQDDDVRKLLNVTLLIDNGHKISKISQLNDNDLHKEVELLLNNRSQPDQELEIYLKALVVAMVELDEERFNRIFSKVVHENGFQFTIINLIYPFLIRIGILWGIDEINPAQEHFISCLIRQKIVSTINDLPQATRPEKFVLFLHQGELHEVGLLVAHYLLKSFGFPVIYLGQDVPMRDLLTVGHQTKPSYFLSIFTTPISDKEMTNRIDQLSSTFPNSNILYSGVRNLRDSHFPKNVLPMDGINDFMSHLKSI